MVLRGPSNKIQLRMQTMTVDAAIEQLTEFRRIYGGDGKLVIHTEDGSIDVAEIKPVTTCSISNAGIVTK